MAENAAAPLANTRDFRETPIYRAIDNYDPVALLAALRHARQSPAPSDRGRATPREGVGGPGGPRMEYDVTMVEPGTRFTYMHVVALKALPGLAEGRLVPMVHQLALAGSSVDAVDRKGRTPLELAIRYAFFAL